LHEAAIKKIMFELDQIQTLIDSYDDLIQKATKEMPNLIELTALAAVLHSFYNGIENIFQIILKKIDRQTINSSKWHKELLLAMSEQNAQRNAVISIKTMLLLPQYLSFRHFYRHSYSFYLNWEDMKPLINSLNAIWDDFLIEAKEFLTQLDQN